jgi:hypothetical protein
VKPDLHSKINGHRVTIYRRNPPCGTAHGEARTWGTGKFIIDISPDLKNRVELEVHIHELLHCADWSKDEHWVQTTAADIARILWELGYRRQ